MSEDHLDDIQSTPIQQAYRTARRKAGKAAVHAVLVAHGAASGVLEDVPAVRRDACLRALQKLARDGSDNAGSNANLHKQAYGERPKPPRTIDEAAIWNRWNSAKRPTEEI